MLSTLSLQTSCTPQEGYLPVPVISGRTIFSWVLTSVTNWMRRFLTLFRHSQTCITGELKMETLLLLTGLRDFFYQMGRLHGLGGMRQNTLLKRFG